MSHNQQDTTRPWSPAPWLVGDEKQPDDYRAFTVVKDATGGEIVEPMVLDHGGDCDLAIDNPADAALIALAPEMAEAILRADECGAFPQEIESHIYDVARKLRALSRPAEEATP